MATKHKLQRHFEKVFGRIEKRLRFVMSALVMTGVLLGSTLFYFDMFWLFVPLLFFASYIFTYFSVLEDIERSEWIMLFMMPVLFTVSFYLFYFLFPVRWLARVPFMFIYGCSLYAILLTSNIFNVGVGKSLQLYRAAFSVNYFYQTLITFLLFNVLFSFKQNFVVNGAAVFFIVLPMSLQLLWSVRLKTNIDRQTINYSFLVAVIVTQITMLFSFVPVKSTIFALFLTACYYCLTGLLYHYLDNKLFRQTIREYIFVASFVSVIVLLTIQW